MNKYNTLIASKITNKIVIIIGAFYLAFLLLMLFIPNGIVTLTEAGAGNILDLRLQYNIADFNSFFANADDAFISGYQRIHQLDIPYALCYTLFLSTLIYQTKGYQSIHFAGIIPFFAFAFDMLENKFLSECYMHLSEVNAGKVAMASTMSTLKWIAIFASLIVIVYALLTRKNYDHQHSNKTTTVIEIEEE